MANPFMRAEEVAKELGISKSFAYKLIRQLNQELKAKGFVTISGRINRDLFSRETVSDAEGNEGQCLYIRTKRQESGMR